MKKINLILAVSSIFIFSLKLFASDCPEQIDSRPQINEGFADQIAIDNPKSREFDQKSTANIIRCAKFQRDIDVNNNENVDHEQLFVGQYQDPKSPNGVPGLLIDCSTKLNDASGVQKISSGQPWILDYYSYSAKDLTVSETYKLVKNGKTYLFRGICKPADKFSCDSYIGSSKDNCQKSYLSQMLSRLHSVVFSNMSIVSYNTQDNISTVPAAKKAIPKDNSAN